MKLKTNTKILLTFVVMLGIILILNTSTVRATSDTENNSLNNIPNTINLDIKEIEIGGDQGQKTGQLIWEKLVSEQKVVGIDRNDFSFYFNGPDIRKGKIWLEGKEKEISINYTNTSNYNENDKNYIENLLKEKNFTLNSNNKYRSPNLTISIQVGTDKLHNENDFIETLGKYLNDDKLKFAYFGGGGDITGSVSSIHIFKNDVYYTTITLNTVYEFVVTVPSNIENSEDKYIEYAKSKMESEFNINSDIKKISGYWYEINDLGSKLIIKKQEGTPIGNNIFVNNLPLNVNVTVTTKENKTMETEIKNKGYSKILGSYELTLTGTDKLGSPIDITFNVGTENNGKTVYILHQKKNGTYENFEKKVTDGKVTITVSELSPFVLGIKENGSTSPVTTPTQTVGKGEKDETPKTGTVDIIGYVSLITLVSLVGIVELKKRLK